MTPDAIPPDAPRDHVRRPDFPWRVQTIVECGREVSDCASWIERGEMLARIAREGIRRAGYSACQVCLENTRRWPEWAQDPVGCLGREFYGGRRSEALLGELRAISALVLAHREEFDDYLAGLAETTSLDARRAARRKADRRGHPSTR